MKRTLIPGAPIVQKPKKVVEVIKKIKRRTNRDKNAPKKAATPFLNFMKKKNKEFKLKYPGVSHRKLLVKMGEFWDQMPEEEKREYKEKFRLDHARYEKEKEEYRKSLKLAGTVKREKAVQPSGKLNLPRRIKKEEELDLCGNN